MRIKSGTFSHEETIPARHTCQGTDASPDLSWEGAPPNTKSFALIMDDPDAPGGTWVHWLIYNIPADAHGLPHGVPPKEKLDDGAMQGFTSFEAIGYGGPCPPRGHGPHRYYFKLHALDAMLDLRPGITKQELLSAMKGHILAQAELMGRFERPL